jgi:tRNA(fMet)-specific endonuclease VapC
MERYLWNVLLPLVPILPYGERESEWHARERARLGGIGKTPPFADGQIAAVAAVHGLVLITFDLKGFQHFEGLKIEDWRK